jgi:hypothetical protein
MLPQALHLYSDCFDLPHFCCCLYVLVYLSKSKALPRMVGPLVAVILPLLRLFRVFRSYAPLRLLGSEVEAAVYDSRAFAIQAYTLTSGMWGSLILRKTGQQYQCVTTTALK